MPAINFRKRYAEAIASGVKISTIRPPRADRRPTAKIGDVLSLYWGMRTKHCTLIRRAVCVGVKQVALMMGELPGEIAVAIEGRTLPRESLELFAHGEGFKDSTDMAEFFRSFYGSYMQGWLIQWDPAQPCSSEEPSR